MMLLETTLHTAMCVCEHIGRTYAAVGANNSQNHKTAACVCEHTHQTHPSSGGCVCCTLLAKTTTNKHVYSTSNVHLPGWSA